MGNKNFKREDGFFGIHIDLHANFDDKEVGLDVTPEAVIHLLDRVKPDFVQYECKGVQGYASYPTKVGTQAPGLVNDALAVLRAITKERGIGLFIHYCSLMNVVGVQEHPEWALYSEDGVPRKEIVSVFSNMSDELMIPQILEASQMYDLDGVWVDASCWMTDIDYSKKALQLFSEETGIKQIPRKPEDKYFKELLNFNRLYITKYINHYTKALHSKNANLQIADNWFYSTFAPLPLEADVDFLSGDIANDDAKKISSLEQVKVEARFLSSRGLTWDLMSWGSARDVVGSYGMRTSKDLSIEAATIIAQGGAFQLYYYPVRTGFIPEYMIDTMAEVSEFCRLRKEVSFKTETIEQVLLINSEPSYFDRVKYPFNSTIGALDTVNGMLQALLDLYYSVDVKTEHQLTLEVLLKYPVVVLPQCHLLERKFRDMFLKYAYNGGNLVVIGSESTKLIKKGLGVSFVGEETNINAELKWNDKVASIPGDWQHVELITAQAIGFRNSNNDNRLKGEIASTMNNYGKGKIFAVYGPLSIAYFNSHHPNIKGFLGSMMKVAFVEPMVKLQTQAKVEMVIRKKDNRILVHLINVSIIPYSKRYITSDYIPPTGKIEVYVKLDKNPKDVKLVPNSGDLAWEWKNGTVHLTISNVDIHSIIEVSV